MELLTHFRQTPIVHISYHLHEWWWHRSLCKAKLNDRVLLDMSLKTLTANISKDVAQKRPISEEDTINKAQHLELIYTESRYIYNILLNAPRLQTYKEFLGTLNFADGLIGSLTQSYLGNNSQNLGYTYDSTQNVPQPSFQSHHMP